MTPEGWWLVDPAGNYHALADGNTPEPAAWVFAYAHPAVFMALMRQAGLPTQPDAKALCQGLGFTLEPIAPATSFEGA